MLKKYVSAHEEVEVERKLDYLDKDGCGFSFDLDENRKPILESEAARESYEWCEQHRDEFDSIESYTRRRRIYIPPLATCECGCEFYITGRYYGATQCDCGRWYNQSGSELYEPGAWEENLDEWE